MTTPEPQAPPLSDLSRALLLLVFGLSTTFVIQLMEGATQDRGDLLLFAASSGALITALAWVLMLALARGSGWALAMGFGVWIPYLNLLLATAFVRRNWSQGGRAPGLLGMAAMLGQTIASIRLLTPRLPPLV